MFEITFWRAIFAIGILLVAILKYRDGLDVTKTLRAGIIAVIFSFLGSIVLVNIGLISYNHNLLGTPVFGTPPFQHLSAGLVAMVMVHYAPNNRKTIIPFIATFALMADCIVFIAVQVGVIRFIQWNYILNFLFDAVALGIVYYLYELLVRTTRKATA